ncbi:MAG: LysM peptidoglycan-binding domain-containing protein [Myxococcaceae bacterium]
MPITVRSGDSLSSIADRMGLGLEELEEANPQIENFNLIYSGQELNLPSDSFDATPAPDFSALDGGDTDTGSAGTYTIQSGDSLSSIADQAGVSLAALVVANPQITNANLIYPGQVLNLPSGASIQDSAPVSNDSPVASGGENPADIAKQYLGNSIDSLIGRSDLDLNNVPRDVCCANFVSAVLEKAGHISGWEHDDNVVNLFKKLGSDGNFEATDLSHAQPGDPVAFDGPDGAYQHVEIFAGWQNGKPLFIGSNNVNRDGTQSITYDNGSWAYGFHVMHHVG